jgi:hypothetical protein
MRPHPSRETPTHLANTPFVHRVLSLAAPPYLETQNPSLLPLHTIAGRGPSAPNGPADLIWPWYAALQHGAFLTCSATACGINQGRILSRIPTPRRLASSAQTLISLSWTGMLEILITLSHASGAQLLICLDPKLITPRHHPTPRSPNAPAAADSIEKSQYKDSETP